MSEALKFHKTLLNFNWCFPLQRIIAASDIFFAVLDRLTNNRDIFFAKICNNLTGGLIPEIFLGGQEECHGSVQYDLGIATTVVLFDTHKIFFQKYIGATFEDF